MWHQVTGCYLLTFLFVVTVADARAQCEYDVCGYWYSENYNSGVPVEYMSIDMVDGQMVCTKILGDAFVPTGHVTWQGIPTSCTFGGEIFVTSAFGGAITSIPCTVDIYSEDQIQVSGTGIGVVEFHRSNTGHLDFIGVDYSNFPVSCITCDHFFPNVFTPNGDGVNDLFEPICPGDSHLFNIRDRWGVLVYEANEPRPTWDGRGIKGWLPCPPGTYFWSMLLEKDRTGKVRHGMVQLMR